MDNPATKEIESIFQEGDQNDIAEAMSQMLTVMDDPGKVTMFSDLTDREIKLLAVAETVGSELWSQFAMEYKKHKVSNMRRGRKEIVQIANIISGMQDREERGGIRATLKGLL